LNFKNFKSKDENLIKQEVFMGGIISLLVRLLEVDTVLKLKINYAPQVPNGIK